MLKCILIYLWIYIGLHYVIEAADADEHVHIKLHMPSGQRKYTHHHTHHHKKRQNPLHYHSSPTSTQHRGAPPVPPPPPPPPTSHLYHEIPQNYVHHLQSQQQNNIKKLPPHLHESGQLQLEELADVYGSSSDSGTDNEDTEGGGEHMMIPSYLAENFALFPQPTIKTAYETDIIPHNLQGLQHSQHSLHHPHNVVELHNEEGDNEITGLGGEDVGGEEVVMLAEEAENYPSHNKPFAQELSSSSKIRQKEQLLQQILQQQEIINAAKFRGTKYRAGNDYHSENDMTENMMMYSSEPHIPTATTTTSTFAKGTDAIGGHIGIKALTVDDIWSQLQRQYLNKYVPQAQALNTEDLNQQTTTKKKRTTKGQRHIKSSSPLSSSSSRQATSSFWPAKTLNYDNNHQQHQKPHYDDNHSSLLPSSFFSSSTSTRNTDLFDDTRALSRPYNNFNGHNTAATAITAFVGNNNGASEDDSDGDDDDGDDDGSVSLFSHDNVDDIEDDDNNNSGSSSGSHDTSFHENVYQRGKKFIGNTGHVAYGNSNTNNPFNYHDLYASYSTPVTATVATNLYPSTYHPKPSKASSTSATSLLYGSISPTLSHESTSYQWHTQQHNNPVSYQSYHLQHQQQQQTPHQQQQQQHQLQQQPQQQQYHYRQQHPQSSALRLPKATITQMPSTLSTSTSSLSPTMSNDFTSADKSTLQPSRYKKRKNRIKTKRNRIVVI